MNKQVQRAIDLAKKTGDKIIVVDKYDEDDSFVIMNLTEYERLAIKPREKMSLTDDRIIDKINRDIALGKEDLTLDDDFSEYKPKSDDFEEDNWYYYDEDDDSDDEIVDFSELDDHFEEEKEDFADISEILNKRQENRVKGGSPWSIPGRVKEGAEEIVVEDDIF